MACVKAAILAALTILGVAVGDLPGGQAEEAAAFLQSLEGQGSVVAEATLGPGQEPVRTESRVVARLLGGSGWSRKARARRLAANP